LAKEKARLDKEIGRSRNKLANPGFLGKAPPEIVAKVEADLRSALTKAGGTGSRRNAPAQPVNRVSQNQTVKS